MSDLHLEARNEYVTFDIPSEAPYLILAGDIGLLRHKGDFQAFLERMCCRYERVFLIPGNHEYYHTVRSEAMLVADDIAEQLEASGVVWMDRKRVDIDGGDIILLGCTLHTHVPEEARPLVLKRIQDFSRIGDWSIAQHNDEYRKDRDWLQQSLVDISASQPTSRVIIVTHFPPTFNHTSGHGPADDLSRAWYGSTTLDDLQGWVGTDQISHWVWGHTHWNNSFSCKTIQVLSNQRSDKGMYSFDPEATI